MIRSLVDYALNNRFMVLAAAALLFIWGGISFHQLPVEAYPDVRVVGFLALFGVSVQTGVIMLEYINQLRARGHSIEDSAVERAVLRLRPIMMTMLVATLGLLPAALSHGVGSDSQRLFAMVIVGGLLSGLAISVFLMPALYVWVARDNDVWPAPEAGFSEEI